MENHITAKQKIDHLPDRTIALLALQQGSATKASTCPMDIELADFMQGKLKGQAREQILVHLDQCSDCYQHWMDELRMQPKPKQSSEQQSTQDVWWHKLGEVLHLNHPWQVSTYFATLVIFVVLIQALPKSGDDDTNSPVAEHKAFPDSIAAEYTAMINRGINVEKTHTVSTSKAVGLGEVQLSSGSTAHKKCLDNGFEALQNKASLVTEFDQQYKTECELGQWVALVTVALNNANTLETAFWQRQLERNQYFEQYFSSLSRQSIVNELQVIGVNLQDIIEDPTNVEDPFIIEMLQGKLKGLSQNHL
ncbi:hypothetical protein [Candidatus Albibeggiatoa sp. nov. BB20]|uniref:hypothetical protein n=1 Tax=Candidatus Albibeggiatoa sp. nov. BB20 TaxID=3162723 RepID=UPI00336588CD